MANRKVKRDLTVGCQLKVETLSKEYGRTAIMASRAYIFSVERI